jgi:hypothetical protein
LLIVAIQGSATPSERAFSSGGTTGTAKRNRLTVESFEALQLLTGKSAYRNAHIQVGAHLEAEQHHDAINLSDIFKTNGDVKVGALWKGKGRESEFEGLD